MPKRLWNNLRVWQAHRAAAWYQPRVVEHRYGEVQLQIELSDALGEAWYDRDWPPLNEIRFLRTRQLKPGALVFDIGAHQGVVALMLAHAVGTAGRLIAVELDGHNARLARRNAQRNKALNVAVLHAGVAAQSGSVASGHALNDQIDTEAPREGTPLFSIDDLARRYGIPDVLFIDIEGFELQALQGARETIRSRHPDCFVEVHVGAGLEKADGSLRLILDEFPAEAYEFYMAEEGCDIQVFDPASELTSRRFYLLACARLAPNDSREGRQCC